MGTKSKLAVALLSLVIIGSAWAATDLQTVHLSSNIHATLPAADGGTIVIDDDAISTYHVDTAQASLTQPLGRLDRSDVDAYHTDDSCGSALFSLATTADVAGITMRPADVFGVSGNKALDARGEGVADGVNLNAVTRDPATCHLVVSFDVTVQLNGTVFRPSDLVRYSSGTFSLFRAGAGRGNLDATHVLDTGSVLASFAAPVPDLGLAFGDQDVIEQAEAGGSWELAFEPAAIDPSWEPADTDAIQVVRAPIPGDFRWTTESIEVLEGQGNASVEIERVGLAEGSVTINWTTVDGTAVSGIDFEGSSGDTAFADGQLTGAVSLTLLDDGAVDGDKTFFVDLESATNGAGLVNPTRVTVLIRDDEDFLFSDGFED